MIWLLLIVLITPAIAQADVLYVSPRIGAGTQANPFRAHKAPGTFTDCQRLGAWFLCVGESVPNQVGVVELPLDSRAALTVGAKTAMGTVLGIPIKTTVSDVLWDVADAEKVVATRTGDGKQRLFVHGHEVAVRDAPLASYIPDIRYAIDVAWHLPLHVISYVASVGIAYAAAELSETWTCADDSDGTFSCDLTWTRTAGTVAAIVSNTLRTVNSASSQVVRNETSLDSADMLHRLTMTQVTRATAANRAGGPIIRYQDSNDYIFCVLRDAATQELEMAIFIANVLTVLGTTAVTIANNDTVEMRGVGNDISCRHNNVLKIGPTTEATHNTMLQVGIRFSGSGTDASSLVVTDNSFASNTIPSDATFGPLRRRM